MPALTPADAEGEGVRRDEAGLRLCRLTLPGPPYNEVVLANTFRQATTHANCAQFALVEGSGSEVGPVIFSAINVSSQSPKLPSLKGVVARSVQIEF